MLLHFSCKNFTKSLGQLIRIKITLGVSPFCNDWVFISFVFKSIAISTDDGKNFYTNSSMSEKSLSVFLINLNRQLYNERNVINSSK
jgi:hypothetical protein